MIDFLIKISVVLIAGLIALYQARLNIVINTRIKRIETLRELVSDYVSELSNMMTLRDYAFEDRERLYIEGSEDFINLNKEDKDKLEKYINRYDLSSINLNKITSKIFLHLNDETEIKIKDIIAKNILLIDDINNLNKDHINLNINKLVKESSKIFNKELNKMNKFLFIKI